MKKIKKNGFHDFVENRARELKTMLRFDGFEVVIEKLRHAPIPLVSEYEETIDTNNIVLKQEVARARKNFPHQESLINNTIMILNSTTDENEFRHELERFATLATIAY